MELVFYKLPLDLLKMRLRLGAQYFALLRRTVPCCKDRIHGCDAARHDGVMQTEPKYEE